MKKLLTFFLFLILVLLSNLAVATPINEYEVISSFKQLTSNHIESYTNDQRIMVYHMTDWIKSRIRVDSKYNIDIQKSNSDLSPYTATFEYIMHIDYTAFHKTKAEAEADTNFQIFDERAQLEPSKTVGEMSKYPYTVRHTYAYQDGKWVNTGIKYRWNIYVSSDDSKWYDSISPWYDAKGDMLERCIEKNK